MSNTPDDCTMRHELDAEEDFPAALTLCLLCDGMTRADKAVVLIVFGRPKTFHGACRDLVQRLAMVFGCSTSEVMEEHDDEVCALGEGVAKLAHCDVCEGDARTHGRTTDHNCEECDAIGLYIEEPEFNILRNLETGELVLALAERP